MKIILWIGNEANQKALANKINSIFPIAGIITETRLQTSKITIKKVFEKVIEKIFLPSIGKAWVGLKSFFDRQYIDYPKTRQIDVKNINSQAAYDFTQEINPDLIIVSGTSLIKEKLLSINPSIGIINLHTGLSPYIKGGPNCTNWCIATKQYHLIGNTIMWLDLGIDTGNILTTELTEFEGNESLLEIHIKVMEHAHNLYLKAIKKLAIGESSSVKQSDIAQGNTYYTKQWTLKKKHNLIKNLNEFSKFIKSNDCQKMQQGITTIEF